MYAGNPQDLGAIVKERRRELGWTQQDLAAAMGATRQWVMALEAGSTRTQLGMALHALKVLDLGVDVFHDTSNDELDELLRSRHGQ